MSNYTEKSIQEGDEAGKQNFPPQFLFCKVINRNPFFHLLEIFPSIPCIQSLDSLHVQKPIPRPIKINAMSIFEALDVQGGGCVALRREPGRARARGRLRLRLHQRL